MLDVIIVGAGPAGLSAALVLGRACRQVLVFDAGKPRNYAARALHGFLSRDGIDPFELRRIGLEELGRYDTVRVEDAEVTRAERQSDGTFQVTVGDERQFRAKRLLLATGVSDNLPAIPGVEEMYGLSVFHCPYCDGWELRGQPLAVYGCNKRGYGLAVELLGWSRDVVLCSDGFCELDADELAILARNQITVREDRIARLEGTDGALERIVFTNGEILPRRAMFFTTGQTQASRLAQQLGCQFNDKGGRAYGPVRNHPRSRPLRGG
ncbi:MAG TPA: NAD(P)/FAD-dependent oxidoreductase [Vicinamibacterales bacterium]